MKIPEWEQWAEEIDTEAGTNDPVIVNQNEKQEWEKWAQELDQQDLKTKEVITPADMSWGKAILKGIENFSAADFFMQPIDAVRAITDAIVSWDITKSQMKNLAIDTFRTGIGRQMGYTDEQIAEINKLNVGKQKGYENANVWMNIEDELHRQYGTERGMQEYIANDPEMALTDLGLLLIPALGGTRAALKAAGFHKLAKGAGYAERVATYTDPVNVVKQGLRAPIGGALKYTRLKKVAPDLYGRAIKFHHTIPLEKQRKIIEIALDNQTQLRVRDFERLGNQINSINKGIDDVIRNADPTKTIKIKDLFGQEWDKSMKHLLEVSSEDVVKAFQDVKSVIIKNNKQLGRTELTPLEAQNMKKRFNKELSEAYQKAINTLENSPLRTDAKMAINKTLRSHLETVIPETALLSYGKINNRIIQKVFPGAPKLTLKQINRLEGDLIELRNAMSKSVGQLKTGSFFDFQVVSKAAMGGAGGYSIGHLVGSPELSQKLMGLGTLAGLSLGIIDSNVHMKSKLAIYLRNLEGVGIKIKPTGSLIRLGLYRSTGDVQSPTPGPEMGERPEALP